MSKIPSISKNPNGLHAHYIIKKANGELIDTNAEYFVLRLDESGGDPVHIAACRKAVLTYAEAIKTHLPLLSKDIVERYGNKSSEENVDGRC